jgi:hypothetical protein
MWELTRSSLSPGLNCFIVIRLSCHLLVLLYIAWHCGKPFLSIPQVRQHEFSCLFRPLWGPCSTFWWPRKCCVQLLQEGDKSSHRLADKASCQSAFCKPFSMPTELHWGCSSSFCLFDSHSFEGYYWFAHSMFLLDRSSEGDLEWQSGDQLQLLWELSGMSSQWSAILHHWWLFLGLRTSGRWLHGTSSLSAYIGSLTRKSFYPFRDRVDDNQDVFATF